MITITSRSDHTRPIVCASCTVTLCAARAETHWMATYISQKSMQVAFFSGDSEPVFKFGAIRNSPALCGTFTYVR